MRATCQEFKRIELGISYDKSFSDQYSNELEVLSAINELVDEVNCIYEESVNTNSIYVYFTPSMVRRIEFNTKGTKLNMNVQAGNFWCSTSDLCNEVDLAHHITLEIPGADGHKGGNGFCKNNINFYGKGTATISEFVRSGGVLRAANIMAHELGHNLGMDHTEPCNASFMCSFVQNIPCQSYNSISSRNFSNMMKLLENSCADTQNVNLPQGDGCNNCTDEVIITNSADKDYSVILGCDPSLNKFEIQSSFANNCVTARNFKVEMYYNSNFIEFLDVGQEFKGPFDTNGSASIYENKKYATDWMPIEKNDGVFNLSNVKTIGTGQYLGAFNNKFNGTTVRVVYFIDPPAAIKDPNGSTITPNPPASIKSLTYKFRYNYQIDKTGSSYVLASSLVNGDVPASNDFCNGYKHDIYLDGLFEIDANQTYCQANFYFNPNSKVIVKKNKTLTLNNCLLTSCKELWDGISLEEGAKIIVNGTTISNAKLGIKAESTFSSVSITNQSVFDNNKVAISVKNGRIVAFSDSEVKNGDLGLNLEKASFVRIKNCNFTRLKNGIQSNSTSLSINGGSLIGTSNLGTSKGINQMGAGNSLTLENGTIISNWGVGIVNARSVLLYSGASFNNNFIGTNIINTNGFTHDIVNSSFTNGKYGLISTTSELGQTSRIEDCNFNNLNNGISISNQNGFYGWWIHSDFTNIHQKAVGLTATSNNILVACNMAASQGTGRKMISVEGGEYNELMFNNITNASAADETAQNIGIYIGNNSTSTYCNYINRGTYGINVWGSSLGYYAGNQFTNNNVGLYCGLYPSNGTSVLGTQDHYKNTWSNGTFGSFAAKHLSENLFLVLRSQFTVDKTDDNDYMPTPRSSVAPDWFKDETDPNPGPACDHLNPYGDDPYYRQGDALARQHYTMDGSQSDDIQSPTPNLAHEVYDYSLLQDFIDGDFNFGQFNPEMNWSADRMVYREAMKPNTDLATKVQGLSDFVNTHRNTAIGQLYEAEQMIISTRYLDPALQSALALLKAESTQAMNDLVTPGEVQQAANLVRLEEANTEAMQAFAAAKVAHISDIVSGISTLDGITANLSPVSNQIALLRVTASFVQSDTLSTQDITMLSSIASQCPLSGGQAVYAARGILEGNGLSELYDDHSLCQPLALRTKVGGDVLTISPNPTTGLLHIVSPMDMTDIEVIDFNGSSVMRLAGLDGKVYDLDASRLPTGVYVVKISNAATGASHTTKMIKID